ncbi:hypothetical protein WJ972_15820 [Achromobacter insuavis]
MLAAMRSFAVMAAPLMGVLTTQWITSGAARQILDGVRAEAQARQQLARQLLPGPFPAAAAGIHLWQPLPDGWTAADLERVARDEGLSVTSSEAFHRGPARPTPSASRWAASPSARRWRRRWRAWPGWCRGSRAACAT